MAHTIIQNSTTKSLGIPHTMYVKAFCEHMPYACMIGFPNLAYFTGTYGLANFELGPCGRVMTVPQQFF